LKINDSSGSETGIFVGYQDENAIVEINTELVKKPLRDIFIAQENKKTEHQFTITEEFMNKIKNIDFVDAEKILPILVTAIEQNLIVGMRGPTGTGKTHLIKELARVFDKPLTILNMNCHTTPDEIKGKYMLNESGALNWLKSSVVKAMENGDWLCIEEANFMSEEMASVLYSLLDFRRNLVIDEHNAETISANSNFRIFMTMNPNYEGTNRLNDAIVNRVNLWLDIEYLTQVDEAKLLSQRYPSVDTEDINALTKISATIREKGEYRHLSTRTLENTCKLLALGINFKDAITFTVINTLTEDVIEKKKIQEIINLMYEQSNGIKYVNLQDIMESEKK
jgi:MoxR-like ATPase